MEEKNTTKAGVKTLKKIVDYGGDIEKTENLKKFPRSGARFAVLTMMTWNFQFVPWSMQGSVLNVLKLTWVKFIFTMYA